MFKIRISISYFYQIRNFKPNMIPVSTAVFDPLWYHDFKHQNHAFKDKNGVINGTRCRVLSPGKTCTGLCSGIEKCNIKDPSICEFLKTYKKQLESLDFLKVTRELERIASYVKRKEGFEEDPEIVLIVHESPDNKCSERATIIEWFEDNGVSVKELEYPIK